MWLDGFDTLDGDEGGAEGGTEQQSEAARAKAAKSLAWIQRTKRDEKKAQRDDEHLHICLHNIITSRKYDTIIPHIFPLFDIWIPSHIIIGGFSLIYKPASDLIRDHYRTDGLDKTHRSFDFPVYETPEQFDDETIDPAIRQRINEWIEDIFTIISYDPSTIMTHRFLHILKGKESAHLMIFLRDIFTFFLLALNMHISPEKAGLYVNFILKEIEKKLRELNLEWV